MTRDELEATREELRVARSNLQRSGEQAAASLEEETARVSTELERTRQVGHARCTLHTCTCTCAHARTHVVRRRLLMIRVFVAETLREAAASSRTGAGAIEGRPRRRGSRNNAFDAKTRQWISPRYLKIWFDLKFNRIAAPSPIYFWNSRMTPEQGSQVSCYTFVPNLKIPTSSKMFIYLFLENICSCSINTTVSIGSLLYSPIVDRDPSLYLVYTIPNCDLLFRCLCYV